MARGLLLVLMLLAPAGAAWAQAQSPAPPPANVVKGLFGEREPEPGDEEQAAGLAEPPAAASPAAPAISAQPYDSRVRQSFAAAESFRGRLDGAWTLSASALRGGDLLRFQFTDKGDGRIEGAWRDLKRSGALSASGFLEQATLVGRTLDLRFAAPDGPPIHVAVEAGADGRWTGKLWRAQQTLDVQLRRTP